MVRGAGEWPVTQARSPVLCVRPDSPLWRAFAYRTSHRLKTRLQQLPRRAEDGLYTQGEPLHRPAHRPSAHASYYGGMLGVPRQEGPILYKTREKRNMNVTLSI